VRDLRNLHAKILCMSKYLKILWCSLLLVPLGQGANAQTSTGSWWETSPWDDPERGYWWYPDPEQRKKEVETEKPRQPKQLGEIKTLKELQDELEWRQGEAIMNPTKENVFLFLEIQNFSMDKAAAFADVGRRVNWQNPGIDYVANHPVAGFARMKQDQRRQETIEKNFQNLKQTHALLFFSRGGGCPQCDDQAPVLKAMSNKTGMEILAITLDGLSLPMFPDAKPDNGISLTVTGGVGVEMTPMIFLIDRKTGETTLVAAGTAAADEIMLRAWVLTQTIPGQSF